MSNKPKYWNDSVRLYSKLYQEIKPHLWSQLFVSFLAGGVIGFLFLITGSDPLVYISILNVFPYYVRLIVIVFLAGILGKLFFTLNEDNKTEDALSEHLLNYYHVNNPSAVDLQILEERALQSKNSSATRIQMAVILVPAFAATVASLFALNISMSPLVILFIIAFFLFLIMNLTTEMNRVRFDDAVLISLKIYRAAQQTALSN